MKNRRRSTVKPRPETRWVRGKPSRVFGIVFILLYLVQFCNPPYVFPLMVGFLLAALAKLYVLLLLLIDIIE